MDRIKAITVLEGHNNDKRRIFKITLKFEVSLYNFKLKNEKKTFKTTKS